MTDLFAELFAAGARVRDREAEPGPTPDTPARREPPTVVVFLPSSITTAEVERLTAKADRLDKDASSLQRDRLTNTPKRQCQARAAWIDGEHKKRQARALRAIAALREAGSLPPILRGCTFQQVEAATRTRVDHPSYYTLIDTGEYHDKSEFATALRAIVEAGTTAEDRAAVAEAKERARIAELEAAVRFVPIPGFFPTPLPLVRRMIELAELGPDHVVLEPSAGKGDIADEAVKVTPAVHCVELSHTLCQILRAKGHMIIGDDFETFELETGPIYDRVLMNPPFEKGKDADHVRRAFELLKPGGRLVGIMSTGPFYRSDRKAQEFWEWFATVRGASFDNPPDSFKGQEAFRETGVTTRTVVIDRRAA